MTLPKALQCPSFGRTTDRAASGEMAAIVEMVEVEAEAEAKAEADEGRIVEVDADRRLDAVRVETAAAVAAVAAAATVAAVAAEVLAADSALWPQSWMKRGSEVLCCKRRTSERRGGETTMKTGVDGKDGKEGKDWEVIVTVDGMGG